MYQNKGKNYKPKSNNKKKNYKKPLTYNTVKNMINKTVEYKVKDQAVVLTGDTDGIAKFSLLNATVPGDLVSNREGRKITITSIQLDGSLSAISDTRVRYLLVWDKNPNQVTPNINEIINHDVTNDWTVALRNIDNMKRFIVLKDWKYNLTVNEGRSATNIKYYKRCNLQTVYNTTSLNTIADITQGALFFIVIAKDVSDVSGLMMARLRFIG